LAYLIAFGSMVGFASYTWLLRVAPTPLVSTYAYVNPLVAILVGNLLAHEPLTPRLLIATAVILGAVAVITVTQPVKAQSRPETAKTPALSTGDD
jgi:drug/metabolite transporter (DMT)-like permease